MLTQKMQYTQTGLQIEKKGSHFKIGLSPYAQEEAGDIAFAEMPTDRQLIREGETLLSIEGDKAVTEFSAPFDLKVIRWQESLEDEPQKLNSTDSAQNWILECTFENVDLFEKLKFDENNN